MANYKVVSERRNKALGEFEQIVLLTILHLKDNAYGMTIRREIERRLDRDVSIGAIYTTLERLEKRGMVSSFIGEATPERGGRAKRYFKLEYVGRRAIIDSRDVMDRMWQGITTDFVLSPLSQSVGVVTL